MWLDQHEASPLGSYAVRRSAIHLSPTRRELRILSSSDYLSRHRPETWQLPPHVGASDPLHTDAT
jgi:hypothetical protein